MEADTKDVCAIQDEDILRRMWQQTEDFSRKKEIRAHMYKLREARLKEFYTSGEVLKDVQRSNSSPGLRDQHSKNPQWAEGPTHADSLADHSFLSLKSKEIRDSESPTREVQYRNSKNRGDDGAWTITANVEKSEDGKTLKSSRIATTQGSRPLDGGELAYAAKNEQHSSVYSDGDANNFTKRVGESSKTHAQQQVTIGDDKNYHKSKSTSSSSSSKIVSHHTSTSGNTDNFNPNQNETSINKTTSNKSFNNQKQIGDGTTTRTIYTSEIPVSKTQIRDGSRTITSNDGASSTTDIRKVYSSEIPVSKTEDRTSSSTRTIYSSEIPVNKTQTRDGSTTITSNVYSSDIPDDLKKNIMDGNTKVITETKTLPDGSTVTTTRYETKGSKKWSSTSGSSQVVSNRQVVEQRSSSTTDNKQIEYGDNNKGHHTVTVTKTIRDDRPNQDYPDNICKVESTRIIQSKRNVDDRINKVHLTQENVYDHAVHEDIRRENITKQDTIINKQATRDDHRGNETVKVTKTIQRNDEREDYLQPKPVPGSDEIHTTVTTKTTVHSGVSDDKHVNRSKVIKKHESVDQTTRSEETYPREKEPVFSQPQDKTPQEVSPHRQGTRPKEQEQPCPQDFELTKSCKPPTDPYTPSSPTNDQYSTTYRQEFTNKRISVDISPTHNAFASSLRAVSPDRTSDRNKSRTSLRNSSSSLRSSTSPDKNTRHPDTQKYPIRVTSECKPNDRSSPERKRVGSPRKEYSPERYDKSPKKSPDFTKAQSPERRSPDRKPSKETIVRTTVTKMVNGRQGVDSSTLTKKKPEDRKSPEKIVNTDTITRKTKTSYDYSPVRTPSPTKPGDRTTPTKTTETITTKTTRTPTSPERPSSIRATSPTKSTDRSSPVRSPTKTPETTFNSDTITRKKKISENDKPIDRSSPVRSPIKNTEVIITTKTGTVTKKKSPTEESPRDKSPTKTLERESPVRSRPTDVQDKNKSKKPSSRDSSPTCSTSDIEFISTIVTDLDEPFDNSPEKRPTSLDITVITTEKSTEVADKSVISPKHSSPVKESPKSRTKSSPVKEITSKPRSSPVKETSVKPKTSPVKEVPKRNSFQPSAPEIDSPSERPPSKFPVEEEPFDVVCEVPLDKAPKEKPPLKRTETYEDHCRKMLGLTSESPLVDEYAGREPAEEPLIVKTHYDYGCRDDELIHSHVQKITKHRPEVEPTVDSTDFIKTEKYELEATPENKKSPTKELASPVKPQAKTPTQKTSVPDRKTPEKLTADKKSPEKIIPEKKTFDNTTPEKKIPIKLTPDIKSEKLSPEKKKPKKQEPDEGEYITEYTDEYCERPVSKRPTNEKKPKQTPTLITETTDRTTNKKPTRDSPSPDRKKKPLHEQPQKKEPVTGDYSTEYTDEYGEVSLPDRDSTRHTIDRKISKENVTSISTKAGKKIDKKPVRDSPDKKREKSPKKQPSKKEDSDSEDEYIAECTMDIITTQAKQKPVAKISETITVDITTEDTLYPKQPQRAVEDETKEVRTKYTDELITKSVLKKPKETEPSRHSPNKPTIITDLTDEYYITDKVVSNSHTTNTNTFINQEKYDTDITLIQSPRDTPEREPKKPNESPTKHIPHLEDEHPQEPHIRTHRIDTTVVSETEDRPSSPRRQPLKAIPSDTMECTFTTTVTTNVDEEVYPIRRPTKPEDKQKTRKPEDRKSPIKHIKDEKKDTKITTASKVSTKKSLSTEIDTKRRVPTETPNRKSPTEKPLKEKSPVRQECPRQRSPSPHKITTRKVLETDRITTQVIRKTSNKDLTIKKIESKVKIIEQPKRLPAESPIRKPLFTAPVASSERKPAVKPKATEPVKKHVVTKTISLAGPKPQPTTPAKTSPKTIAVIKTKVSPTTITKTAKTTKTTKKIVKHDMYTSDSDSEPEYVLIDDTNVTTRDVKKLVVTTANIKMTSPITRKEPSPSRIKPDVTSPSFKRSTSSREQSPEKMCPVPVSSEDESGYPRYPDQINEPDDTPLRKRPVTDIPLTEDEDVKDFNRITEIARKPVTRISDIDKVHETDESLLSVTEKVSRFITSAEKTIDNDKLKNPAPKKPRPELMVTEDLEDDECLLSVSDKVTKFISTAEQVSVKKDRPVTPVIKKSDRSHSPAVKPTHLGTKVDENDECLRSVTEKVTHFIQAADTIKQKPSKEPASKVARPEFTDIDETLRTDECLLSVSDKVTKFLTTAEKVSTEVKTIKTELKESVPQRQPSPEKTKPDKIRQSPVRQSPVKRTPEPKRSPAREPVTQELTRPKLEPITQEPSRPKSEPVKLTETKILKSSEAVRKAKALFENIAKPQQENTKQRDILSRPSVWEGRKKSEPKPAVDESDVKLTDIGVYKIKEPITTPEVRKKLTYSSDDEEDTCKRISKDITLKSTKLILNDKKVIKTSQTERQDIHRPKTVSPERELSGYLKPVTKSNSTTREEVTVESITQRTRHLSPEHELPGYMRPITKTSPETRTNPSFSPEQEPITKPVVEHEDFDVETKYVHKTKYENGDVPGYMRPLQRYHSPEREYSCRKPKDDEEIIVETTLPRTKQTSPDRDVPGYMRPLQRHAHSPDRELDRRDSTGKSMPLTDEDVPRAGKKFGVVLRRTDSGRVITTATTTMTERRRSSVPGYPNVEEIQDLDILEKMLDKVVGYEQRRRIRAQIRIVKRLISENKIQYTANSAEKKKTTTTKHSVPVREPHQDRKSPSKEIKRPTSPVKKTENKHSTYEKEEYTSSSYTRNETTRERSMSPDVKKKSLTTTSIYKTDLKPAQPPAKVVNDNQPSWVTNRNLKKAETVTTEDRKMVPMKKKETPRRSPSPQKETRPIDCITSSYGIGPTDENGQPLFGIRALRKAAAADKVQVRGTVVTSQFYSENGQEPVGEVTVTKYSNNPKELNVDDEHISSKAKGFASVTTTQKFGSRGTPSLKNIVDKKKTITDKQIDEDEIFKTTSTKVTRRGSVKALSQKFIENAVEISRNERQIYPKAGLILRTSSFKDSASTDKSSSRESSPGFQEKISLESITSDSHKTTTTSTTTSHREQQQTTDETKTFLNSHTRVANAQDVITRMKNAEREEQEGDTAEDREARMLLNKFLGAQVLMSGMEPLLKTQSGGSSNAAHQLVRKVQKTKTVTSSTKDSTSKPIALSKRFQCPITPEVLEDIWDEQTLRLLLEQCTDYEERRVIRARLRQVMAEQEAVANVVASAVADRDIDADRTGSLQERIETTKKTYSEGPVTTTQVSTRVISSSTRQQVNKPISPFAKFRQLDKQNSLNSPPSSPRTPVGGGSGAPLFKFTDPALSQSASTVKDRLLHWCQMKTKEYQNIKLSNFSTCWADGMAFCALIHHFLPDAFDYHALTPQQRRHNFTLAFTVADEQAGIAPLLDVDDMVAMRRPDWKCVFTYVQSIYRRFKDED